MVRAWTPPRPDRTPRPPSHWPAEPTPPPASPSSAWGGVLAPRPPPARRGGAAPPPRLAQLGLAGLLATSLLVCLSATQSELLLPSSLRPLPESLAGPLAGLGLKLGIFALIAAFGAMLVCYALAIRNAEK